MEGVIVSLTICGILVLLIIIFAMTIALIFCRSEYFKAIKEIDSLKKLNDELKNSALTDPLTGLFNRRYLEDILDKEIGRASRYKHKLVIMFVDLDRFKIINDTLGHDIGDKVLKKVAENLKKYTRRIDFVARPGGDEFVVILPETSLDSAQFVGKKLIKAIEAMPIENTSLILSASIGVCQFDPDNPSLDLIKEADKAMYEAKNGGRGKVSISLKSLKFLSA